ncbi:MAG: prepilin peptidase [Parcubacteria group bacterium]|nr:prepilin peptidase [Parcubacteria group bacterium]
MPYFSFVFIFIFGTIIGSFLNVIIARYHSGRSLGGRSQCFACGKTLSWKELFPLLSFIIQKGRCSVCKSAISWQYPIVELVTGLIFLSLFAAFFARNTIAPTEMFWAVSRFDIVSFVYALFISILFLIISVYDIRHTIIPNGFVYPLILLAGVRLFTGTAGTAFDTSALITGIVFFLFFGALWIFSRGRVIGLGDAKLALAIGWLLGPTHGTFAILIAVWSGAIVGILLIAASKMRALFLRGNYFTLKSEIPFGPFLAFGALTSFLLRFHIGTVISLLSFYG